MMKPVTRRRPRDGIEDVKSRYKQYNQEVKVLWVMPDGDDVWCVVDTIIGI